MNDKLTKRQVHARNVTDMIFGKGFCKEQDKRIAKRKEVGL